MTEIITVSSPNPTHTEGDVGPTTVTITINPWTEVKEEKGTLVWVNKIGKLITSECEVITTITHGTIYGDEVDEKYLVHGSEVPYKRIIKFVEND